MAVDSANLMEELSMMKRNLSEVIDECVFVERQRDLTEQRLTAELEKRDQLVVDTLFSLLSLVKYLTFLERRVIVPAFRSFSDVVKLDPEIGVARSSAFTQVEQTLSKHELANLHEVLETMEPVSGDTEEEIRQAVIKNPIKFSLEEAYVLLRGLIDGKTELTERVNDATFYLSEVFASLSPLRARSPSQVGEVRGLRQKIAVLTQELHQCDGKKCGRSSYPDRAPKLLADGEPYRPQEAQTVGWRRADVDPLRPSSCSPARDVPVNSATPAGTSGGEDLSPQLSTYNMTIEALNRELAIMEENCKALQRRSAQEREELKAELTLLRRSHQKEQEECNSVLGRITMELEQLVGENAQLKKRLRDRYAKKRNTIS